MDTGELISTTRQLLHRFPGMPRSQAYSEAKEFLRIYAGPNSSFYQMIADIPWEQHDGSLTFERVQSSLQGFLGSLETGYNLGISPEKKAQLDVVSDFLGMAQIILEDKKMHAGAAAMLIGATLEEFLRNWIEDEGLSIAKDRPTIDDYAKALRAGDFISKQNKKSIDVWAGQRNDAAHGHWEEVEERKLIRLMLSGVDHFIQTHT